MVVRYFGSIMIGLAATIVLSFPVKLCTDVDSKLLHFVLMLAAVMVSLAILFFKDGYHNKRFKRKELLLSLPILFALLLIVIRIIGPAIYISGPTDSLARYILLKVNPGLINGKAMLKQYAMDLMTLAFVLVYSPIILLAEYLGAKKHKKDFAPSKML